jgi:O-antigen ligase
VLSLVQVATSHGYPDAASASVAQFVGKRAIGFSEAAGTWAAFLVIPLGFALARWRRTRSLVYALATFAITIGVILSGLRTAWLALIAVAVVAAFLRGGSRRVRLALPLLLVVALAVTLASGNFQHYLAGGRATWNSLSFGHGRLGEDESAQERFLLMHAEIDLGVRHPLTGVGLGNIGPRLGTLHRSFRNSSGTVLLTPGEPIEKHDVFTGLFAELGLPGVAAFGAVLITTATVLLRARAAARRRAESEIVEALLLTLFATALLSLATEADRQVFLWWVVGVAAALGAVLRETMRAEPVRRRMKPAVYPARFERYYWSRQW